MVATSGPTQPLEHHLDMCKDICVHMEKHKGSEGMGDSK